ncbi:hypothetical protein INT43_005147 [Umbelopsis isabellina]|uniref:Uncharacterized protein n=1 Tax=Mortierella isabellina TaxID=91625 RepID=A0A8H7PGU8_MORIS|nr:hypothetical protein INT43_005147 [Umbelopsis isabellina]
MLAYTAYKAIKDKKKKRDQNKNRQPQYQQQQGNGDYGHTPSKNSQTSASAHSSYSAGYSQSSSNDSQHYMQSPPAFNGRSALAQSPHGPNNGHSHYTTAEQQRMQQELSYAQHNQHTRQPQYNGPQSANALTNSQVQQYHQGGDPRYR